MTGSVDGLTASNEGVAPPSPARPIVGEALLHPISLLCILLWGLNDHVFKSLYGNWLTGKLSDFTGMVAFPLLVFSLLQLPALVTGKHSALGSKALLGILIGTGACFSLTKLTAWGALAYTLWGAFTHAPFATLRAPLEVAARMQHTQDPTDLIALPMLALAWWLARRYTT